MDAGWNPKMGSYDYKEFVDPRVVTHRYMKPSERAKEGQQMKIYSPCISEFGSKHKWLGFIDTDEFLEVKASYTLYSMLSDLESNSTVGALAINWLYHNSGGLEDRPTGRGIRKTFTQCLTDDAKLENDCNAYMKSFVKASTIAGPLKTAHGGMLKQGMVTVDEKGNFVEHDSTRDRPTKEREEVLGGDGSGAEF